MAGIWLRAPKNAVVRLLSSVSRHSSGESSASGLYAPSAPTLFTAISRPPNACSAVRTTAAWVSGCRASPAAVSALPPASRTNAAVCASLAAAKAAGAVTLNVGLFINSIISFLIIASAIFAVVKALSTLQSKAEAPADAPAGPSEEVLLLREIRDSLKK